MEQTQRRHHSMIGLVSPVFNQKMKICEQKMKIKKIKMWTIFQLEIYVRTENQRINANKKERKNVSPVSIKREKFKYRTLSIGLVHRLLLVCVSTTFSCTHFNQCFLFQIFSFSHNVISNTDFFTYFFVMIKFVNQINLI